MDVNFYITAVTQVLENNAFLTEALFFPEILRFETIQTRAETSLIACAKHIFNKLPLADIHKRSHVNTIVKDVSLSLEPLRTSIGWKQPVTLNFQTVQWTVDDVDIVYVPALQIEMLSREKDREKLPEKLSSEIKAQLLRTKSASSLKKLAWIQRSKQLNISELSFSAYVNSPKQLALQVEKPEETVSILSEIGTYLNNQNLPSAYEVDKEVELLANLLSGRTARSVLLVGDSGVGKTAIFHHLVKHRTRFKLSSTNFWATTGSKLVAGMCGFGMWQERCQQVCREANKQKTILFFGNLVELMQVGKSEHNSQGIASFFRPYLLRGDIVAIVECTPEQLPLIEKEDPHLLEAFQQLKIDAPDIEKGRTILSKYVFWIKNYKTTVSKETLILLDQLHRRYATYSAYPGRPLRFLKNLLTDLASKNIKESDVLEAFSHETGLPLFILDDRIKLDLADTHKKFSQSVVGQLEAINLVVDMLATVKTRLTRGGKPIASFLFIGPTGVGKTEMAKCLAEFLFQNRNRLSRFDMSEYSDPIAVKRLIGGVFGSEGLLTAKVREQPFSIILFDEFEKAHPLFFDLLLQILGEGRLTDNSGKLADFRNCVIIMTSNLGAEAFQKGGLGFQTEDVSNITKHFASAVKDFLRPELFNRIDRVVPFTALSPEMIKQITLKELKTIEFRDGILHRNTKVTLHYGDGVTDYLAEKGYSFRYGARSLKRTIEKEFLVPLSDGIAQYSAKVALKAEIEVDNKKNLQVSVSYDAILDKQLQKISQPASFMELIKKLSTLSHETYLLHHCSAMTDIQNEIFRLTHLEKKLNFIRGWKNPEDIERLRRLPILNKVFSNCKEFTKKVFSLEDNLLFAFYAKEEIDKDFAKLQISSFSKEWQETLLSIYALSFSQPNYVTLAFYSDSPTWLFKLAKIYFDILSQQNTKVEIFKLTLDKEQEKPNNLQKNKQKNSKEKGTTQETDIEENAEPKEERIAIKRQLIEKPAVFFKSKQEDTFSIVFGIEGEHSYLRYASEGGVQTFSTIVEKESVTETCFIDSSEIKALEYNPPVKFKNFSQIKKLAIRRKWEFEKNSGEDSLLKKKFDCYHNAIADSLLELIETHLSKNARNVVLEESDE